MAQTIPVNLPSANRKYRKYNALSNRNEHGPQSPVDWPPFLSYLSVCVL